MDKEQLSELIALRDKRAAARGNYEEAKKIVEMRRSLLEYKERDVQTTVRVCLKHALNRLVENEDQAAYSETVNNVKKFVKAHSLYDEAYGALSDTRFDYETLQQDILADECNRITGGDSE